MAQFTGTFTADDQFSEYLYVRPGFSVSYSFTTAGLTGSVVVEKANLVGEGYETIAEFSASGSGSYTNQSQIDEFVRVRCVELDEGGGESVAYTLAEVASAYLLKVEDPDGRITKISLSALATDFLASSDHNDLSNIQGGTTDEYYHLTSAQNTSVAAIVTAGYAEAMDQGVDTTSSPTYTGLTVNGTASIQVISYAEVVQVEDNIIVVNYGEAGAGITAGVAGLEFELGSLTNYQLLMRDSDKTMVFGEIGSLVALAGREDSPNDNGLGFWNDTTKIFETDSALYFNGTALYAPQVIIDNINMNGAAISTDSGPLLISAVTGQYVWVEGVQFDGGVITEVTSLTVDNLLINGNDISSTTGNLTLTPVAGSAVVIDGGATFDGTIMTGITSLSMDSVALLSSSSGTATLSNIDAIDSTTESTLESALDFYGTVQNGGTGLTQRKTINFGNGLTASDNSGSSRTDVSVDIANGVALGSATTMTANGSYQTTNHQIAVPSDGDYLISYQVTFNWTPGASSDGINVRIRNTTQGSTIIGSINFMSAYNATFNRQPTISGTVLAQALTANDNIQIQCSATSGATTFNTLQQVNAETFINYIKLNND